MKLQAPLCYLGEVTNDRRRIDRLVIDRITTIPVLAEVEGLLGPGFAIAGRLVGFEFDAKAAVIGIIEPNVFWDELREQGPIRAEIDVMSLAGLTEITEESDLLVFSAARLTSITLAPTSKAGPVWPLDTIITEIP